MDLATGKVAVHILSVLVLQSPAQLVMRLGLEGWPQERQKLMESSLFSILNTFFSHPDSILR